jgi:hypothetical protein
MKRIGRDINILAALVAMDAMSNQYIDMDAIPITNTRKEVEKPVIKEGKDHRHIYKRTRQPDSVHDVWMCDCGRKEND